MSIAAPPAVETPNASHGGAFMGTEADEATPLGLKCPACEQHLGAMPASLPGSVRCDQCGFEIASHGDYWDACVDKSYPRDFARQWVMWEDGRLGDPALVYGEDPEHYFREFLTHTSLQPEHLASMRVLEVGFGHGRLLRRIQKWCPSAFGLDLARPLPSAQLRPGSTIFGNLLSNPFVPGQFDLVICRGVIQCTPDPESSFEHVARQVGANGLLYVAGFYEPGTRGMLWMRNILPSSWRYPDAVLLGLTRILTALRAVLQGVRERDLRWRFLKDYYQRRQLEIFDVLAPHWSTRIGEDEIVPWFASRGFEVRKVGDGSYFGVLSAAPAES
jgi:SAM-dependent methyltransferase